MSILLLLVGYLYPTSPTPVRADTSVCLKISEVYPAPATGESEWVELWNCADIDISLLGFTLFDLLATPSEIFKFNDQIIPAQSYLAFDLPSARLNNTGDGVTLYDSTNQVVNQMSFDSTQMSKSWALIGGILGEYSLTTPSQGLPNPTPTSTPSPTSSPTPTPSRLPTLTPTVSPTTLPTPTVIPTATPIPSPTSSPTPTTYLIDKSKLQLTEVAACPTENESEWLELYWQGNELIEFSNWQIIDRQDNHVTLNGSLKPNEYSIISWSKSILNNSGDKLRLVDQNQATLAEIELPACQAGQSFALLGDTYQLVNTVTKGTANPQPLVSPSASPPINAENILGVSSDNETNSSQDNLLEGDEQPGDSQVDSLSPETVYEEVIDSSNITPTDNLSNQEEAISLLSPITSFSHGAMTVIIGSLCTIISSLVVINEQKHQTQFIT